MKRIIIIIIIIIAILLQVHWGKGATNITDVVRTWLSRSERTWAFSAGGPGLNVGEHMAGRSRLGTILFSYKAGQ